MEGKLVDGVEQASRLRDGVKPSPAGRGSPRSAHRRAPVIAEHSAEWRGEGSRYTHACRREREGLVPSPRPLRARCSGADSLRARSRAPGPTLSRWERVTSACFAPVTDVAFRSTPFP